MQKEEGVSRWDGGDNFALSEKIINSENFDTDNHFYIFFSFMIFEMNA